MPLESGKSSKTKSHNVKELMHKYKRSGSIGTSHPASAKKAQKQAVAIAYSKSREKKAMTILEKIADQITHKLSDRTSYSYDVGEDTRSDYDRGRADLDSHVTDIVKTYLQDAKGSKDSARELQRVLKFYSRLSDAKPPTEKQFKTIADKEKPALLKHQRSASKIRAFLGAVPGGMIGGLAGSRFGPLGMAVGGVTGAAMGSFIGHASGAMSVPNKYIDMVKSKINV